MNPETRIRVFFAKNRSAIHSIIDGWKHLLGMTNESDPIDVIHTDSHPISLCKCHGIRRSGDEFYDDHLSGCAWLKIRCKTCRGTGWCQSCLGDGIGQENVTEDKKPTSADMCVSTESLTPTEIRVADAHGKLYVDDDGYGMVSINTTK
jgi:hypothetical protein